jgi:hypothetical protein
MHPNDPSLKSFVEVAADSHFPIQNLALALQLRVPFEVGFLRCGLMASAPDGPGDDEGRFNATLDQTPGNTTDFLE